MKGNKNPWDSTFSATKITVILTQGKGLVSQDLIVPYGPGDFRDPWTLKVPR